MPEVIYFWIGLGIYVIFGSLAICMLFNWIATGNPNHFPFDDDPR